MLGFVLVLGGCVRPALEVVPVPSFTVRDPGLDTGSPEPEPTGEPIAEPIAVPSAWCANQDALDAWGEAGLTPALAMWDDLVPDEVLFTFAGPCETAPGEPLQILRTELLAGILGTVDHVAPSPPRVQLSDRAPFYSPILDPDGACDHQMHLDRMLGYLVGRVMGLPAACPGGGADCPSPERDALMASVWELCDDRQPNAWDADALADAQGLDTDP